MNWSVTSQAREAMGAGSICHKQLLSSHGTTVADLVPNQTDSTYTFWGPIRSPQSSLSLLHRESTRGLERWCHQRCTQDLSFSSRAHIEKNKKQGVIVHAHKCICIVPIGTYMHTFTHHTHVSHKHLWTSISRALSVPSTLLWPLAKRDVVERS